MTLPRQVREPYRGSCFGAKSRGSVAGVPHRRKS